MNSYLSLIPISAKIRKRQNRMTLLCIVISVFLVTTIFSVADMLNQTENDILTDKHGSWHIKLDGISSETADEISKDPDVVSVGMESHFNEDGDGDYRLNGKRVVIYGIDETYLDQNSDGIRSGNFPANDKELLIGPGAAEHYQIQTGDTITFTAPSGETDFKVSGIGGIDETFYTSLYSIVDMYLTPSAFQTLMQAEEKEVTPSYYIQFTSPSVAAKSVSNLKETYHLSDDAISENIGVMGRKSSNQSAHVAYQTAAFLLVLVVLAGVLMISGSMNSNVAQRAQFFGMMRCIGMSRQQVKRFVRLEALNWCKSAIPAGLILGTIISQIICMVLHYGIGGEFSTTPVFKLSPAGILTGILTGLVTVLLAAQAPARRASEVSPAAAVSGNTESDRKKLHRIRIRLGKVETSLGTHHAVASKKNWFLMTASFAFTIILVLCFSVVLDFAELLMPSLCPWQPDVLVTGYSNELVLTHDLTEQLRNIPGVSHVWGLSGITNIPASCEQAEIDHVTICSYDDFIMGCSKNMIVNGTLADTSGNKNEVMTIYNKDNPLKVGDTVKINDTDLKITCAFSEGAFSDDVTIVCPETLFHRLIGTEDYNIVGVQLNTDADSQTISQIAKLSTDQMIVQDVRQDNRRDFSTYLASRVVAYGFLGIIALISLFNIINSISMSVSAHTRQYGAMRAVGMDDRQLFRMIAAEGATYAVSGILTGFLFGLPLCQILYTELVTRHFGIVWSVPVRLLLILILFVSLAAALAVYRPVRRIQCMPVTESINEL